MRRRAVFAARVLLSNLTRLPLPYKVTFAVTYRCNSRCKTCGIWRSAPSSELAVAEITEFLEHSRSISYIGLTGGEIFMREDIGDILAAVLDNTPRLAVLQFPTNGLLTNRIQSIIEQIPLAHRRRIAATVAMDGPPTTHDHIRGVPGSWEQALNTFAILRHLQVDTRFGITISAFNQGHLGATIRSVQCRLPDVTAHDFHINIAHRSDFYYGNTNMPAFDPHIVMNDLRRYVLFRQSDKSIASFLERKYAILAQQYITTSVSPLPCQALRASCFIDPSGTVYPCIAWDNPVGSIRECGYRLAPIWRSERALECYRRARELQCPQCWTPCEAFQAMLGALFNRRLWTSSVC